MGIRSPEGSEHWNYRQNLPAVGRNGDGLPRGWRWWVAWPIPWRWALRQRTGERSGWHNRAGGAAEVTCQPSAWTAEDNTGRMWGRGSWTLGSGRPGVDQWAQQPNSAPMTCEHEIQIVEVPLQVESL